MHARTGASGECCAAPSTDCVVDAAALHLDGPRTHTRCETTDREGGRRRQGEDNDDRLKDGGRRVLLLLLVVAVLATLAARRCRRTVVQ